MKTFWVIIAIVYVVLLIPALRTSIAFWLYRNSNETANTAMKHGFILGFLKIWFIYPIFIFKDCFSNDTRR